MQSRPDAASCTMSAPRPFRCMRHPWQDIAGRRRKQAILEVWLALHLAVSVAPQKANASGRFLTKRVHRGETAKNIALYYYGTEKAAPVVKAAAGMSPQSTKRLSPGTLLKLPIAWSYRIRPKDTWRHIGRDYLSAGFRGRLLALINGKDATKSPPAGHVIRIPATLWFKPRRTVRLRRLVRWLSPAVSDAEKRVLAERIVAFNGLSNKRLRRNRTILIPLFSLEARQGLVANDLPIPDQKTARLLKRAHATARALLDDGRYEQAALVCLKTLPWAHLAPRRGALVYKDLAYAFVAMEWFSLARTMAAKALALDPKVPLDPVEDSPKILRLFGRRGHSTANRRP